MTDMPITLTDEMLNRPVREFLGNWESQATGDSGDIELEKAWLRRAQMAYLDNMPEIIHDLYVIFCKKQHDYGPQNIALGGPRGVTLRMVDKFSRLWNLLGMSGTEVSAPANVDEPLMDTFLDLADYGIIGVMSLMGDWPRMEIKDAFREPDNTVPLKHDTEQIALPFSQDTPLGTFESEPE